MPCAPTFVSSPVSLFTGSVSSLDFHDSIILHACMHSFTRPFSNATVLCVYVLATHTGRRPGFCLLRNSQQRKGESHMSMKSFHWVFLTVSQLRKGRQVQFSVGSRKNQDRHHKGGDTSEVSPASLSHVSLTDKYGKNTWVQEPQERRHRCKIQRAQLFGYQAATGIWKACSPSAKDVYIFLYPYYLNLLKTIQSTSVFKI